MLNKSETSKNEGNLPKGATVIQMTELPLTESGEPDIAAILAANGLSHIDLSKVQVLKADAPD